MKHTLSRMSLLASCLIAFNLVACEDPSTKVDAAKVNDAKTSKDGAKTDKAAKGTEVKFDQKSGSIEFTGSKVTGKHDGGFKAFQGAVTIVENSPEKSRFKVTIDMNSTFSDSDRLTGHLKNEDFFDVKKFPESSFESTAIEKDDKKFKVTGNFTLHGVTKSITFPVDLSFDDKHFKLGSEFSINRKDFGIVYKGKADDLIRDGVVIRLKFDVKR